MGTPQFSVPTLERIVAAGHEVVCVYSQPPSRSGRGMALRPSPVHAFAEKHGFEVRAPTSLKEAGEQEAFAALNADVGVVIAYGLLLPKAILDAPRHGCLNMHASDLPRWRGAAPIQRAIMAGDTMTAAIAMKMEPGLDTGPICLRRPVEIGPDMTAGELHDVVSVTGADVMAEALQCLAAGSLTQTPQAEVGVTYASKIEKGEALLDFARPARALHDHIRGLSPFPGAWFELEHAGGRCERIKVLRSELVSEAAVQADVAPGTTVDDALTLQCAPGLLRLSELQRAGKKPCDADALLRGLPLPAGTRLGPGSDRPQGG